MPNGEQEPLIPVQPVDNPIICKPYVEPTEHWAYRMDGTALRAPGRRRAAYWFKVHRTLAQQQMSFLADEESEDLPLVNNLRDDVKRWRDAGYRGAEKTTKELLHWWKREDKSLRLFFCQLEAVETVIYIVEIRLAGKSDGFRNHKVEDADLAVLLDGALRRMGCKMATGSGKTVVMAMLIAWAFCNHAVLPSDPRFPGGVLVCCPNLTVKERLQVLRPENKANYFAAFDLVPVAMRPLLQRGKVLVTNWHVFAPESEHAESGKSYAVVNKGPESDDAFARRVLGDLYDVAPLLVLNDEGHHCWRPAALPEAAVDQENPEVREATVWVDGLEHIHRAVDIRYCVDLSATPFYIGGSGYVEGRPFPWLVSDFGLVDAIDSGIVKIPRLPVSDTTGHPEPKYFRLWENITKGLMAQERLPGGRPKPEVVYKKAEDALLTLAGQWVERFGYIQQATDAQVRVPPALIVVCDNTDIAEVFYRHISGETVAEAVDEAADDEDGMDRPVGRRKPKTKVVYGQGDVFPDYFSNTSEHRYTLRIDTKLLAEAESGEPDGTKKSVAQELRRMVATVGKQGEPGEHLRCIVSVGMLTEGWDASNVTHVFGVRAFGSQLLCEQVVGRGLRRMDYVPDPKSGLLHEEYVDVYGIPFSVVPFKGRKTTAPAPEDRPIQHVKAMPQRAGYELHFPVVEGYAFALKHNLIKADIANMERLGLEPNVTPTAVFVQPTVGYRMGTPGLGGPGEFEEQDRQEYYHTTHTQAIEFAVARDIVSKLVGDGNIAPDPRGNRRLRLAARHDLFPQVLRLVKRYVAEKVDARGADLRELGLRKYFEQVVERLLVAVEPDESEGEPPILPILNRYKSTGTTADVDFKTVRPTVLIVHSHIDQVVADTNSWEQAAVFRLEVAAQHGLIQCYARNDHLGLVVPYEYAKTSRGYEPDFLVRLADGRMLLLEVKGYQDNETAAKHAGAQRWVSAVNNWGQLGRWDFLVCHDPQVLEHQLARSLGVSTS